MADRIYQCPFCPYTAKNTSNLSKHKARHTTERAHACECGSSFKTTLDLMRHKRTHLDCPHKCGFTAASRAKLSEHAAQCPAGDGQAQPPLPRIACGLGTCTYTSTRVFCVREHQRCMHNPALDNALACKVCDFVTGSYAELLSHVRGHARRGRGSAHGPHAPTADDEVEGTED